MNITLTLDQEATDALKDRVDLYNAGSGQPPLTAEQFMEQVHCGDYIAQLVESKYQQAVARVAAAFRPLPYEQRAATVVALEAQAK
jgi:hypothetical protein